MFADDFDDYDDSDSDIEVTVRELGAPAGTGEPVQSSGAFQALDLADFDQAAAEPAGEKPEICQVVGCRRPATCEVELIEGDRREIGRYCERHAEIED
ncbi:MAG: hypothetical protein GXX96_35280 [Planctomycetaceae bacterium]|nr:hypothetical protein [Planctomycetaceae bacterium]